jgi:hypothetical protein
MLRCVGRYRAQDRHGQPISYDPGDEVHASDEELERLLRDSPTSFERVTDEPVEVETVGSIAIEVTVEPEPEPEAEPAPDFASMKLPELRDYAADNDINIAGARTKAQIIARLT